MRKIGYAAVMLCVLGMGGASVAAENNSSLAPLIISVSRAGEYKYRAPDGTSTATIVEWSSVPGYGNFMDYLNAYNAPHWMNVYQSLQGVQGLTVTSGMTGATATRPSREEMYGVSWARDLMVASAYADSGLQPGSIRFNGMTDANLGYTPFGHGTHDLGMAFDLGVKDYISSARDGAQNDRFDTGNTAQLVAAINALPRGWSLADAIAYTAHTLPSGQTGLANVVGSPTTTLANDQVAAIRNFLSLYSVTKGDGTAGLTSHLKNTTAADLFGGLISSVYIGGKTANGQNPYPSINAILNKLGITSSSVDAHQTHFHVYLNPPAPLDIGPNLLLADGQMATPADAMSTDPTLQTAAQSLFDYSQTLITGEELMFIMDVPTVPAQDAPIVLAQSATPAATTPPDYLLTSCDQKESTAPSWSADHAVDPAGLLKNYMQNKYNRPVDFSAITNVTLLEGTTVGKITSVIDNTGRSWYRYDPPAGYEGRDRAVFLAEYEGKVYKIVMNLVVSPTVGESPLLAGEQPVCPPPKLIKVTPVKPSSGANGYDLNSLSVIFANLQGAAVGQSNGNGITLDTTAAGNTWFIDTTPGLNEEFLPTSNPNEWVAKAGSAAAGKMDMLSVLLHEYGHALGINHSADPHDYMGTTLQAGVRRLPSAEEMALMQSLVAEAKASLTPTLSQWERGQDQNAPGFPTLPLSTSFIGFLGLLRGSRYGGVSIAPDASTLVTKYAVAANASLTNGSLNAADGWSTLGGVEFNPTSTSSGQASTGSGRTDGGATLKEVSGSQTRLSQVFLLNPSDRFLSFTLSGTALDNLTGAPDDAFEVALLDANTGASLLGGTGLTHSDAFLNLQADGTQNAANCVTCINNADGITSDLAGVVGQPSRMASSSISRTYRVDLAGVPSGTAANLSFDLIGFGQNNSHVTVSDVRLSGLPQLHDDAATMLEDGTLAFNPFAQVDNASVLQLGSHHRH